MSRIVGVGNPMWDVFAPAESNAAPVARFGQDTVSHVEAAVMRELLGNVRDAVWVPGGGARNALSVLAGLGRETYVVGAVGADDDGERYRSTLTEDGIADCLADVADAPTGASLTVFSPGNRSALVVAPAAALRLDPRAVAAVDSPAFVIFEGFLADRDDLVEAVLSYADEAGATLVVDLGHPGVAAAAARVADAAGGPVIVFGTEAEVAAVAPGEESPAGAPESGVSYLREAASVLVVKRGTRGATVYRGASTQADCPAQRAAHARTELSVVDTTGAGDVFAGAFLEGQLRGLSDEEACRIASFAARLSLGDYGGRLSRVGIERLEAVFGDAGAISSR